MRYNTFCFVDNLLCPATRSWNMIGTSFTFWHLHRTMISNPILKPIGFICPSPLASTFFVVQKNPDIGSVEPLNGHANAVAPALMILRCRAHAATPPPSTFLEPTLNSTWPVKTGCATAGTLSGSCCRSASMHKIVSYLALENPRRTAELSPLPSDLLRTWIRIGYVFFRSSTILMVSAVPLLSSSTTSSSAFKFALFNALNNRVHNSLMFSYSLYVGTITESSEVPVPAPADIPSTPGSLPREAPRAREPPAQPLGRRSGRRRRKRGEAEEAE
mmetsp:Transcript_28941/g.70557  ORF Transcript_28941/g.70557 Transcript_28941/m.70557 type:complete len:274 (+) Transcript_28941:286-1107(+)